MDFIKSLDLNTIEFISEHVKNNFFDSIFPIMTNLGEGGVVWIIISLGLIINKKYRQAGILTLISLLVTYIIGDIFLKNLIERNRPFLNIEGLKLLVKEPTSFSFPSGHTSSAFAAATMLSLHLKKYSPLFYALAIILAFSRIYLYVHYLSDVVAGMCLGIIVALLFNILINEFLKKRKINL